MPPTKTRRKTTRRSFGQIRKLPSGRFQARYSDPNGRLNSKGTVVRHTAPITFEAAIDAEGWLAREQRLIQDGAWTPPAKRQTDAQRAEEAAADRLTLAAYAEEWIAHRLVKGKPLSPRTQAGYRAYLAQHIAPTFGQMALEDITSKMVKRWHGSLLRDKPTQRARVYSFFTSLMNTAVAEEIIDTSPARIRGAGTVERAREVKPLATEQVDELAAAMPENRRAMVQLAAWTGARFGELAELRRSDVDLKGAVIHIRRGVVRVAEGEMPGTLPPGVKACGCRPGCLVGPPKSTAGVRTIDVPPHVLPILAEHMRDHVPDLPKSSLVFAGKDGRHLSPSSLYGRAERTVTVKAKKRGGKPTTKVMPGYGFFHAREVIGRPDLAWHHLRHTSGTRMAEAGATVPEIMKAHGQSTMAAAQRYMVVADERRKEIARRMSDIATNTVVSS